MREAPWAVPGRPDLREIWFARLQVATLGPDASTNRLPSCDTHTLNTPEHALGSYYYTTDDEGWPRARVCLVHVPSAVSVPVGFRRSWPIQTAQGHPSAWFFRYYWFITPLREMILLPSSALVASKHPNI